MMFDDQIFKRMAERHVCDVAEALGIEVQDRNGSSPGSFACYACGAIKRHGEKRRGAAGTRPDGRGWGCHVCKVSSDGADLVAYFRHGKRYRDLPDQGQADCITWYKQFLGLNVSALADAIAVRAPRPQEPEQKFPDAEWLHNVWNTCKPVNADEQVSAWLTSKRIDVDMVVRLDLARALPVDSSMCHGWGRDGYRLIVPLRDVNGVMRNVKARRIDGGPEPKSMSVKNGRCRGLSFYDLRTPDAHEVFIVEGEKKWLQMMSLSTEYDAVIGIGSGLYTPELIGTIHKAARIYILTDADTKDQAGARYANDILKMLTPQQLKRTRVWASFEVVSDENGNRVQVRQDFIQEQLKKGA